MRVHRVLVWVAPSLLHNELLYVHHPKPPTHCAALHMSACAPAARCAQAHFDFGSQLRMKVREAEVFFSSEVDQRGSRHLHNMQVDFHVSEGGGGDGGGVSGSGSGEVLRVTIKEYRKAGKLQAVWLFTGLRYCPAGW